MAESSQSTYREQLFSFAKGEIPRSELPLDEPAFWEWTVVRAARPGRTSSRAPNMALAAERLLSASMGRASEKARTSGAIAALGRPDARVRRMAIKTLRASEGDDAIFEAASDSIHDSDPEVRTAALFIFAERATAKNLPVLLQVLKDTSDMRCTVAQEAIVRIGGAAVPGLVKLLDNDNAGVRWRATLALSRLGVDSAASGLLKAFHDEDPNVTWVAADGLLALGSGVEKQVLRSVLELPMTPGVRRALHHYAEHASPRTLFAPLEKATVGLGASAATLTAVDAILRELEAHE